VTRGRFACH